MRQTVSVQGRPTAPHSGKLHREHQTEQLQHLDLQGWASKFGSYVAHVLLSTLDCSWALLGAGAQGPGCVMGEVMWLGKEPRGVLMSPASSLARLRFVKPSVTMMDN